MRAFIGIQLKDIINSIDDIIVDLKEVDPFANYTRIKNIHITLEFLGEVNNLQLNSIDRILSIFDFKSFGLILNKITNFRNMVILEVENNPFLFAVQASLREKLVEAGFNIPLRKYFPHVTISRKTNIQVEKVLNLNSKVEEIILFSSNRINNQLIYTPILQRKAVDIY